MNDIVKAADKLLQGLVPGRMPGATLLLAKGDFIHCRGFGYADVERRIEAGPETSYMVASITKQFAVMAAMKLVERGSLSLNDTIDGFFPQLPSWARTVTVKNLMNHSSGIPDYFDDAFMEKYCRNDVPEEADDATMLDIIASYRELLFVPGSDSFYSNSAYVLLGMIVEKVSGQKFSQFTNENVLKPAGMAASAILDDVPAPGGMAVGYDRLDDGTYVKTAFNRSVIGWADGNLCSTAPDLYRWHRALMEGRIIRPDLAEEIITPLVRPAGGRTGAALGLFVGQRGGVREIWHTGSTVGFTSRISRFPLLSDGTDAAVILLTNVEVGKLDEFAAVCGKLAHLLLGAEYEAPVPLGLPGDEASNKLIGSYRSPYDESVTCDVTAAGDGVHLKGTASRGLKGGAEALYVGLDSGDPVFALLDGSDLKAAFRTRGDDTLLEIDMCGRIIRLEKTAAG